MNQCSEMIKSLPLVFSRKYFYSKRSANAIHYISTISILGISIGTAALILVLSVFNGFEDLITKMLNQFNPDIKVVPVEGKFFEKNQQILSKLKEIDGVLAVSQVLEEKALFESDKVQDFGTIKGVDNNYRQVASLDSTILDGQFVLSKENVDYAIIGFGLGNKLGSMPSQLSEPISVYSPNGDDAGIVSQPFTRRFLYPGALFSIQQDVDYEYMIASLAFVEDLLGKPNTLSALELKIDPKKSVKTIQKNIQTLMGDKFAVKNRYQQEEAFLKLMNIEKWVSFAILSLTLLLVAFNMTCALWMLVLEKKSDLATLKSIGMKDNQVFRIFLNLGMLLSLVGFFTGLIVAVILYILQKTVGIVGVPEGFAVNVYPVEMQISDVLAILIIVSVIGFLASYFPAKMASRASAIHKYGN